jgi:hypothetical protein
VFTARQKITFRELIIAGLENAMSSPGTRGAPPKLSAEQSVTIDIDEIGVPVLKRRKTPPLKKYLSQIDDLREELGV